MYVDPTKKRSRRKRERWVHYWKCMHFCCFDFLFFSIQKELSIKKNFARKNFSGIYKKKHGSKILLNQVKILPDSRFERELAREKLFQEQKKSISNYVEFRAVVRM